MKLFELLQSNVHLLGSPLARLVGAVHKSGPSFLKSRSKSTTLKISHLICNNPLNHHNYNNYNNHNNKDNNNKEIRFAKQKTKLKGISKPMKVEGQDQCAHPNSDGTKCTGVRTNNNKQSWCCNGECAIKERFQAQCESICPENARPGSDCSRSLESGSSYCCPSAANNKESLNCISSTNFETQCPDVTVSKDISAFGNHIRV